LQPPHDEHPYRRAHLRVQPRLPLVQEPEVTIQLLQDLRTDSSADDRVFLRCIHDDTIMYTIASHVKTNATGIQIISSSRAVRAQAAGPVRRSPRSRMRTSSERNQGARRPKC